MRRAHPAAPTQEQWRQVREAFFQLVDCDASARPALLARTCGGDAELRAEVESLLAAHETLSCPETCSEGPDDPLPHGFPEHDRFTLGPQLGTGGFGRVHRAFDRQLRQWVALKVLRRRDREALLRFEQEFRAMQQLQLPHLVRCFELFSKPGNPFFTMELVDGLPLLEHLRAAGPAGEARSGPDAVSALFAQLAEGVLGLHQAGWLHRDLKPSNVLVDEAGRVVLVDLGLARKIGAPEGGAPLLGSPRYMAPELFTRAPATPAADWYGVGVMLHEALTGQAPWLSSGPELVEEKCAGDPPPPRSLAPNIPARLDALCSALLRREPGRRPRGAEVLRRLGRGAAVLSDSKLPRPRR